MQRTWLIISTLIYAGIGTWTLIDPVGALEPVGVAVVDARGVVELRAMYGGLELGMAAFLAWCLLSTDRIRTGLVAATLTIGGLAVTRLAFTLALQPEGWLLPILTVVELSGAMGGAVVLWATRR